MVERLYLSYNSVIYHYIRKLRINKASLFPCTQRKCFAERKFCEMRLADTKFPSGKKLKLKIFNCQQYFVKIFCPWKLIFFSRNEPIKIPLPEKYKENFAVSSEGLS